MKILKSSDKQYSYLKLRGLEKKGINSGKEWEKYHIDVYGFIPTPMGPPNGILFYLDVIYK